MTLFSEYRRPWGVVGDEGSFDILDADGVVVISTGTYSGDGDGEMNLSFEQAKCLVAIVNESKFP